MAVEGEGRPDSRFPHDLETDAVDEAQRAAGGDEVGSDGGAMNVPRDPFDPEDGHDVPFEDAGGFDAQAARGECRRFDENIVVAQKNVPGGYRFFPERLGRGMMRVAGV